MQGANGSASKLIALDVGSSHASIELVSGRDGRPTGGRASTLARRRCAALAAGWRLERALADSGPNDVRSAPAELGVGYTLSRAGRPQTDGAVEAVHRLVLEVRRRPAFARTKVSPVRAPEGVG
ncbi:MAG TPA: hypothetical protein VNJ53_05180 [Gaiellaceae bacterium]|nr:hypothetical protein [Gaiellaceae bacterium]